MTEPRYLALVATTPGQGLASFAPPAGLVLRADTPTFRLFTSRSCALQTNPSGFLLGPINAMATMQPVAEVAQANWQRIGQSRGRALVDEFWGDYVAFLITGTNRARCDAIVRAPLGRIGCYHGEAPGILSVASHPDLLADSAAAAIGIDAMALALHLAQPELARPATCLAGIASLTGGTRLTVSDASIRIDSLWSPWRFCSDRRDIGEHETAGQMLRDVLIDSVAAQTAFDPNVLLLLSGGLDSSVLAACLHAAGRPFHALNLVTDAVTGDERGFARMAATATHADLTEAIRRIEGVDLARSHAARAARPFARAFTQETERIATDVAGACGATAILDGGGGDNLFFNVLSLAAMAEVLERSGPGRRFWTTAAAFADLAGSNLLRVIARSAIRTCTRDNHLRHPLRGDFLSARALAMIADQPLHLWHDPPVDIGPGKAAHVALLAPAQSSVEQGQTACGARRWVSPLVSQPAIERALGLPIWSWFAPGRNRAAARFAFARDLPSTLIDRRTKGTPAMFLNSLFDQRRDVIRGMLLDGALAGLGLLDLDRLRAALAGDAPARDLAFVRIMELVDAEAWARSWA